MASSSSSAAASSSAATRPPRPPRTATGLGNRFTVYNLFSIIKGQDNAKSDLLVRSQKELAELKKKISTDSKKNFGLEREIRNLDQKIALLIRNRITLEEVMASSGDISLVNRTITLKDKREREYYGQLFCLLQNETQYVAKLARLVKLGQIDNLLQTVMFTLYGNQYDEGEEHLLLSMFKTVLVTEFGLAKSTSNLLRANTALTRMMTTYTRRGPGQQYLKQVLTKVLTEITSAPDLTLEINPTKVYEAMLNRQESETGQVSTLNRKPSAEEAAANKDVQKIIEPRLRQLGEIADNFVQAFVNSLDLVPYGIRWICKQIRVLTEEKFSSATREQVCSLIGGFYLLRFVNPAVVTPQAFMLVETKLSANTRRNLTLLAKILQNLANNVKFGGVKEFYMAPLNVVLDRNRPIINKFLTRLTEVDDLEDHLNLDRYIALGKTGENVINISLNEMYFIHSLLNQHINTLAPDPNGVDSAFHRILKELGPAPPQLPRKENANVDLKLENHFLASDSADGEPELTPEQIYTETKYLLFSIIKSLPQLNNQQNQDNIKALLKQAQQYAVQRKNKELGQMIDTILKNCERLVKAGVLKESDGYAQLRKDAMEELLNYEQQITKTKSDVGTLTSVLNNINEHNQFLQQQLEAYKEYLGNVRQNCSSKKAGSSKSKKEKTKSKSKSKSKKGKIGPFKFSHSALEKDGIIIESEVPNDRRSSIYFSFSSSTPGVFDVLVLYKSRHISDIRLQLDDLLERQHVNQLEYETDFLKLNVNLLIYLLNKHFLSS
mmetsp:Transcript_371/g.457  ORF Transcript_371/g.457 Transcript_371/m.457 type:complete len:780 (+) Transcript_371:7-2346(+)